MTTQKVEVSTTEGFSGVLARDGAYTFACDPRSDPKTAVSLSMPARLQAYESVVLHPIFQMNQPEGFLLERLRNLLAKTTGTDPLLLLALLGGDHGIGRVRYELAAGATKRSGAEQLPKDVASAASGEVLSALLSYRGSDDLFESLLDRYLLRSGLSGVQPKVLVPERPAAGDKGKAFGLTPDLIVKSGQKEFPGLAINEFVCMTAVARAGVAVPEFFLSEDRKLFVMRRFDRRQDGSALGFEDMAVLSGKGASRKYEGSYGLIAKVIQLFCSTESVPKALAQLFDMVALSCLLGNGDAHLKNFGVLYEDVVSGVVRMAPAYDIVNTTCYLPEDNLALSLSGNRGFFASRQTLLDFADVCNVSPKAARSRLLELCDVVTETFAEHRDLAAEVSGFSDDVTKRVKLFLEMFRPHSTLPDGQAPATGIKTKAKQSQHSSG